MSSKQTYDRFENDIRDQWKASGAPDLRHHVVTRCEMVAVWLI